MNHRTIMNTFVQLQPNSKHFLLKVNILKTMMYCGVLWGLYNPEHQGWAIRSINQEYIFPFWLNSVQALHYAKIHWPHYQPRKITSDDFKNSLLPTLTRLKVTPALCNHRDRHFKLTIPHMQMLFFQNHLSPSI